MRDTRNEIHHTKSFSRAARVAVLIFPFVFAVWFAHHDGWKINYSQRDAWIEHNNDKFRLALGIGWKEIDHGNYTERDDFANTYETTVYHRGRFEIVYVRLK